MGWKEYNAKIGIVHKFGEFNCKDFWVKLRRLDSFSYGDTKEVRSGGDVNVEEMKKNSKLREEARKEMEEQLVDCILDWNISDPTIQDTKGLSDEEKAKPLLLPTANDPSSLDKLPSEFIAAMFIWLRDDSELSKQASKMTGTSS